MTVTIMAKARFDTWVQEDSYSATGLSVVNNFFFGNPYHMGKKKLATVTCEEHK
jgi:hypothetical protein